ncbi:hypothetical protein DENSPDRAFT_616783 [Dentipellis sp. KUC8613]|nr:hypothetical protein DENSPDRAFT_616783 [Dentipellis sp. KUC8613]
MYWVLPGVVLSLLRLSRHIPIFALQAQPRQQTHLMKESTRSTVYMCPTHFLETEILKHFLQTSEQAEQWHASIFTYGLGLSTVDATALSPEDRTSLQDSGLWSAEHELSLLQIVASVRTHNR